MGNLDRRTRSERIAATGNPRLKSLSARDPWGDRVKLGEALSAIVAGIPTASLWIGCLLSRPLGISLRWIGPAGIRVGLVRPLGIVVSVGLPLVSRIALRGRRLGEVTGWIRIARHRGQVPTLNLLAEIVHQILFDLGRLVAMESKVRRAILPIEGHDPSCHQGGARNQ